MDSQSQEGPLRSQAYRHQHRTGLVTLLFTDMVDSTALKQQLGDKAASVFFDKHHRLVRQTLQAFTGGQEIETAGDSFLLTFSTPSDAVHFALRFESELRNLSRENGVGAQDRIGIHVGEVLIRGEEANAQPKDLYGIQIDACSRVMSLAKAGQVLMTRGVFDSARQVLKGEDIAGVGPLEWLNHGPYLLKGLGEPVEICEVREEGKETGGPPTNSEKAQRQARANEEPVLGWRPAVGQGIPNTRWSLERKLGEGGFGEVWLARNNATKELRVFKFCFQAERVRYLKRELTLFRLLKERVGDHPNIVAIRDVCLEQPPYYVEMEYVEGCDLRSWCVGQGGMEAIPLETRLELIAQAADGLQAAHDAGIIHRDIKPANILIGGKEPGRKEVRVKLTDFGIGQVVSEEYLQDITRAGFTQTIAGDSSSGTGTQLYMAPELLAGKPASIRSDIYSLGVVLFQTITADFKRPVTTDWTEDIADPLLREDLRRCLAGKPPDRFDGAGQLARNLRALPQRQAALVRERTELAAAAKAAYRRGIFRTASASFVIVALLAWLAVLAVMEAHRAESNALTAEQRLYVSNIHLAQLAIAFGNCKQARDLLEQLRPARGRPDQRAFEWRHFWRVSQPPDGFSFVAHTGLITGISFAPDGKTLATCGVDAKLKLWDWRAQTNLATLPGHTLWINRLAFSPDGNSVITASDDETAVLWDVQRAQKITSLHGHGQNMNSAQFLTDGKTVVTAEADGALEFWDRTSGVLITNVPAHSKEAHVSAPRVGSFFVSAGSDDTIRLWQADPWRTVALTNLGSWWPMSIAPDGNSFACGGENAAIRLWSVPGLKLTRTLTGHARPVSWIAFSSDSKVLASAGQDNTVKIWDLATGEAIREFSGPAAAGVLCLAFAPDGKTLAGGKADGTVKLWDLEAAQVPTVVAGAALGFPQFSSDGNYLVMEEFSDHDFWRPETFDHPTALKVWNTASRKLVAGHPLPDSQIFALSPSGTSVLFGAKDSTIREWDFLADRETAFLTVPGSGTHGLALSAKANLLVVWQKADPMIRVFDLKTREQVWSIPTQGSQPDKGATFSPDGSILFIWGHPVELWRTNTRDREHAFDDSLFFNSIAFSPDSKLLACGTPDLMIRLWDLHAQRWVGTLAGHSHYVVGLSFSPDGRTLASGGADEDGSVRLWSVPLLAEMAVLVQRPGEAQNVQFAPDGNALLSLSGPRATFWEAAPR